MKNMKRLFTLFISLAMVGIVQAEERTLQGTVIDQDGKPIEGAKVVLTEYYNKETIKINSTTDETGAFSITYDSDHNCEINISADGHTGYYSSVPNELQRRLVVLYNALNFKAGELTSIILPIVPDASLGKYFRLDREVGDTLVFEREYTPQANVPYAFIPKKDTRIDLTGMDLSIAPGMTQIAGRNKIGIYFIGSYTSRRVLLSFSDMLSYINGGVMTDDGVHANTYEYAMTGTLFYNYNEFGKGGGEVPKLVFHDPDEDYTPFVKEGKKWECTISWGLLETNIKKEYYSISGDTIVNGITCKKLHGPYSTYAVYEKDGKVYCHEKVNGDFHLLYDFTCHEGDVVNVVNPEGQTEWGLDEYRCTIKKVDTIITKSGHRLKRFTLQAENLEIEFGSEEEYVWIEGVGSPWEPLYPVGYWETAGGSSYLNACYVNGEQLFVGKDIYYGTGIESIHNEFVNGKSSNGKSIYDLSGRRVSASSALPKGVYVRNGRKVVMLE